MNIKLSFDPSAICQTSEGAYAIAQGGLILKFWALYKRGHATSNEFLVSLKKMAGWLEEARDPDKDLKMYEDIDGFVNMLGYCQFHGTAGTCRRDDMVKFVAKHWDYFNPNINRNILIEFESKRVVQVLLDVNGKKENISFLEEKN